MFDLHCHILPGVDDGAKDKKESEKMLKMAYRQGIRKIVATPHYYCGMEEGELEKRAAAYQWLCSLAAQISSELEIYPGAELYYESGILDELKVGRVPTLNNTTYVLVEFPVNIDYNYIFHAVQNLQYTGFRPVLAHIERYDALRNEERVSALVDSGAYMQVNAGSVSGKNGWSTKRYLLRLMKSNLIHLIGTDAHDPDRRQPLMQDCINYIDRKMGRDYRDRICYDNPSRIVKGEYLSGESYN